MSTSSTPWAVLPSLTSSALPTGTTISSDASTNSGGGGSSGAGLYLYTFLATVIVLISVSLCILVRGLTLRRRRRRHLAAMLAIDPNYVPPGWEGDRYIGVPRTREEVRPPPSMCELRVSSEGEKTAWTDIMPLTVAKPHTPPVTATSTPAVAPGVARPRGRLGRYFFPTPPSAPSGDTTSPAPGPPASVPLTAIPNAYSVAVMIAMPDAARANIKPDDDDAPPPYIEFGLAHMPARGPLSGSLGGATAG